MFDHFENEPSAVTRYLREIRHIRPLSREEENRLVREIENGHGEALNRLVESNLSFVVRVASGYRYLGLPFEDLLNEGNLGLIEAARRFDPSKGTKFITYAVWWVRKAILRALAEKVQIVRVPHNQQSKIREIRRAEVNLRRQLGRSPTTEEISGDVAMKTSQVTRLRQVGVGQSSLDRPIDDEQQTPWSDLLRDLGASSEERMIKSQNQRGLKRALIELTKQQRTVILLRFGLASERPMTLKEIGVQLGVSRERVRQIEGLAKERLLELMQGPVS